MLTRELSRRGFAPNEVRRLTSVGELSRVRRGAYVAAFPVTEPLDPFTERIRRHRLEILGTVAQLHPRALVSHGSAAVLHALPIFPAAVERVHITRDRSGGGVRRAIVQVHGSPLAPTDANLIDDIPTTSLARTVVDLARTLPYEQAVAIGDQALRAGLDPAALADALEWSRRWRGAPGARRAAGFFDARSESVGESFSRVGFDRDGLPRPELQLEVYDEHGRFVGRTDFGWPALHTLGEFDGREKYLRRRREAETVTDYLIREKTREDALRSLGWEVVRWMWADLSRPGLIADRLRRAFARGANRI